MSDGDLSLSDQIKSKYHHQSLKNWSKVWTKTSLSVKHHDCNFLTVQSGLQTKDLYCTVIWGKASQHQSLMMRRIFYLILCKIKIFEDFFDSFIICINSSVRWTLHLQWRWHYLLTAEDLLLITSDFSIIYVANLSNQLISLTLIKTIKVVNVFYFTAATLLPPTALISIWLRQFIHHQQ